MGTTQIFSALADDYGFYKDKIFKVIQQAPCTVTSDGNWAWANTVTLNALRAAGIFEVGGPTWYEV